MNFLLLMSEFASLKSKTGDEIILFVGSTIVCIKRRNSFMFSNISSGMQWGPSLAPTWTITLSGFFISRGTSKSFIPLMVAPGKVHILIIFLLDVLYSRKPDNIESPIIKVMPFFHLGCLLLIPRSAKSLKVVISS